MANTGIMAPVNAQPVKPTNNHGHSGQLNLSKSFKPAFSNSI